MHGREAGNRRFIYLSELGVCQPNQAGTRLKAVGEDMQDAIPFKKRVDVKTGQLIGGEAVPAMRVEPRLLKIAGSVRVEDEETVSSSIGANDPTVGADKNLVGC